MKHSRKSAQSSYRQTLKASMSRFLPAPLWAGFRLRSDARWIPRMLAFVAILMAWGAEQTLGDRLEAACETLTAMFPSRRRVGKTYQGFIKALLGLGKLVLEAVTAHLRGVVQQIAGPYWTREGFVVFAADGIRMMLAPVDLVVTFR